MRWQKLRAVFKSLAGEIPLTAASGPNLVGILSRPARTVSGPEPLTSEQLKHSAARLLLGNCYLCGLPRTPDGGCGGNC